MTDVSAAAVRAAARLLGAAGEIPAALEPRIREAYKKLEDVQTPRCVWKFFETKIHGGSVSFGGIFSIEGQSLAGILSGCPRAVLMAVTLGPSVDRLTRLLQATSMSEAVVFDACASAATEALCDRLEGEILRCLNDGEFLTMRFSPGYGDVPLAESAKILSVLEAQKKIGLAATASGMLIPIKSVTAVIGVAGEKRVRKRDCSQCGMSGGCPYKKRGDSCGV